MTTTEAQKTTLDRLPSTLAGAAWLDRVVDPLATAAERLLAAPERRRLLQGGWLGHPVHPLLTDVPIGFWTSAFVLDLAGRRCTKAGDGLIAAGVASAVPTMLTGLADWHERSPEDRRIGAVHAVANLTATVLYAGAFAHRVKGNGGRGFLLGLAGAAAATAGGYLGGHLAFGERRTGAEARQDQQDQEEIPVDPQGAALAAVRTATG
jgi:uncharacterized membrane protein